MDLAISTLTGDLANRLISFLINKYTDHLSLEEKVERLQQLLLRVRMVVEEADSRYITNSCMLIQLWTLAAAIYQGHRVLNTIRYRKQKEFSEEPIRDCHVICFYSSETYWLYRLNGARDTVRKNISRFGAHPQELFSRGHPVHLIGRYILSPAAPSRVVESANGVTNVPEEGLPRIMFVDLIAGSHVVLPRGDFRLISWESRLPPYTSSVHVVRSAPSCVDDKPETPLSAKKRVGLFT